jgi:hypothetical protein
MAGQILVLPDVTVAAAGGAPKIFMNAADMSALKIGPLLKHVVSARSLEAAAGGGVVGRCRNTGKSLTPKGTGQASLGVTMLSGREALGVTAGAAGLALPPGSLTNSFTYVAAVHLHATDIAGSAAVNLLSGFDVADAYIAAVLRYYGQAYAAPATSADKFTSMAPTTSGAIAVAAGALAGWNVVVIDFNNDTRILSIAVNQVTTFAAILKSAPAAFAPTSYLEVGYHPGAALLNSKFGDLYTFSDSLLKTELGKTQLTDLVSAVKTYYSIA